MAWHYNSFRTDYACSLLIEGIPGTIDYWSAVVAIEHQEKNGDLWFLGIALASFDGVYISYLSLGSSEYLCDKNDMQEKRALSTW